MRRLTVSFFAGRIMVLCLPVSAREKRVTVFRGGRSVSYLNQLTA